VEPGSVVTLGIRLEAVTRQEGDAWLAWCPPLDVMTQANTKSKAIASLQQAVELWFESCITRNVLDQALHEAGFHKLDPAETPSTSASVVRVHEPKTTPAHAFSAKRDYIEVSIPAYIAAQSN
jgi:predicted RNase H-like HicB family nuclease